MADTTARTWLQYNDQRTSYPCALNERVTPIGTHMKACMAETMRSLSSSNYFHAGRSHNAATGGSALTNYRLSYNITSDEPPRRRAPISCEAGVRSPFEGPYTIQVARPGFNTGAYTLLDKPAPRHDDDGLTNNNRKTSEDEEQGNAFHKKETRQHVRELERIVQSTERARVNSPPRRLAPYVVLAAAVGKEQIQKQRPQQRAKSAQPRRQSSKKFDRLPDRQDDLQHSVKDDKDSAAAVTLEVPSPTQINVRPLTPFDHQKEENDNVLNCSEINLSLAHSEPPQVHEVNDAAKTEQVAPRPASAQNIKPPLVVDRCYRFSARRAFDRAAIAPTTSCTTSLNNKSAPLRLYQRHHVGNDRKKFVVLDKTGVPRIRQQPSAVTLTTTVAAAAEDRMMTTDINIQPKACSRTSAASLRRHEYHSQRSLWKGDKGSTVRECLTPDPEQMR